MSRPALYLAVDGGNSKTDVLLGTVDGQVLAVTRGPGSSPHALGVPGAVAQLDRLVHRVRSAAGLPAGAVVERAECYLAGADLPVEVARLAAAFGAAGWARAVRVDNDAFALLRVGTDAPDAVAVIGGAGINCVGRAADGRTARWPALGEISGDWGGGQHLERLVLWHAARGEDGRGPATALTAAVIEHCGRSTVEDVSIDLHLGDLPADRLAGLARRLFAAAAAGDPVAGRVVDRQAEEVVTLVRVAAGRLDLLDRAYPVVLGGAVLAAGHERLDHAVADGIRAVSPAATVVVPAAPPVVGAALLALDAFGAPAGAAAALRAAALRSVQPAPPAAGPG